LWLKIFSHALLKTIRRTIYTEAPEKKLPGDPPRKKVYLFSNRSMLRRTLATWLLVPLTIAKQEDVDAVMCSTVARAESKRCLMQLPTSRAAAVHLHQGSLHEEVEQQREDWTGKVVDIDFGSTSLDMQGVNILSYSDFSDAGESAVNATKPYMEMTFNRTEEGQILSNSPNEKILMFGFKEGTAGLTNVNLNRIWSGNPKNSDSKKVYGFIMTAVPGKKAWKYNILFAKAPPGALKTYPKNGMVQRMKDKAFVTMTCDDEVQCRDGAIVVSSVKFSSTDTSEAKLVSEEVGQFIKTKSLAIPKEIKPLNATEFAEVLKSMEEDEPLAPMLNLTLMGEEQPGPTDAEITIDFANASLCLDNVSTNYMQNWNVEGAAVSDAAKPFLETELPAAPGGQVLTAKAGVRFFGFRTKPAGVANVMNDRFWTKKPKTKGAYQVYAIQVLNVSAFSQWNYTITYARTPPSKLKVFPKSSKLKRSKAGNLYIVLTCDHPVQCTDDTIEISKIILVPKGKKLPKQEELASPSSSNVSSDASDSANGFAAALSRAAELVGTGFKTSES